MNAPVARYHLGFGSTWTTADADVDWTEVTEYVHLPSGLSTNRGRSTETDDDQAGTASFRLNNEGRLFDPTYSAGTYFGDLKPGVPVKVEAEADGDTFPVFRGFVEGWPQDYAPGNTYGWVDVRCTDGFGKLATAGMPTSVYAYEVEQDEPVAWWRLAETSGSVMGDSSGSDLDGTYTGGTTGLSGAHPNQWETVEAIKFDGDHIGRATGCGVVVDAAPLVVEVLVGELETTTGVEVAIRTGSGLANEGIALQREGSATNSTITASGRTGGNDLAQATFDHNNSIHLVYRKPSGSDAALYADGVDVTDSAGATPATGAVGTEGVVVAGSRYVGRLADSAFVGSLADVAIYDTDIGEARIEAHAAAFTAPWDGDTTGERIERLLDVAGWPGDLRDVATGLSILGPAVLGEFALPLLKRAQGAEQGRLFVSRDGKLTFLDRYYLATVTEGTTPQATLSDDGSDNGYSALAFDYDTALVKNRIRASRRGGTEVEVTDATSITDYGDRSDSGLTGLDFNNDHQARSAAEFRLEVYKEPTLRVRPVTVKLHGLTESQQADLLDLELGYRVNVERTPQGVGSAIDEDYSIEGISHRVSNGAWEMTLRLAPIPTHMSEVGLWDTGEWDTAVWGY